MGRSNVLPRELGILYKLYSLTDAQVHNDPRIHVMLQALFEVKVEAAKIYRQVASWMATAGVASWPVGIPWKDPLTRGVPLMGRPGRPLEGWYPEGTWARRTYPNCTFESQFLSLKTSLARPNAIFPWNIDPDWGSRESSQWQGRPNKS